MSRRARTGAALAGALLVAALVLVLHGTGALRSLELSTVDARFAVRGATDPPAGLVLVAIDDATFDELDEQWPFRRRRHAELIDRLRRAGARTIAYDVLFAEPSRFGARDDDALIEAVQRARGRVVLAASATNERGESDVFGGAEVLDRIGARAGSTLLPTDPGAVMRRVPAENGGLPSFAAVAAALARGRPAPVADVPPDGAWIDFHGPAGSVRTVSFVDVLRGRIGGDALRGRIAVVGPTERTLQDRHPTSTTGDEPMAGAEIQAHAISTFLRGLPLRSAPGALDVLLVVLMALAAPVAAAWLPGRTALLATLAAPSALVAGAALGFAGGVVVAVAAPLLAFALGAVVTVGIVVVAGALERRRVRDLFRRFVGEQVVDAVLARADGARLGGERLCSTVMFCDLRGFTAFSERVAAPEPVIEVLNRYLGEMSDAVLAHGGTLVSYSGDGMMAVFGAPIEFPDHADRAVDAAREMLTVRLPRFNAWLREHGLDERFAMGIGVNSGIVMSGNVGSDRRLEYTAIGDTTNTASRLQARTKETGDGVLISDTTRAMLRRDHPDLRYLDAVTVRGKLVKVNLWTLARRTGDGDAPGARALSRAGG